MGVFAIASGGVGKKTPIRHCQDLWASVPHLEEHLAPDSLTSASFVDKISSKPKLLESTGEEYHPLLVASEEIGFFFLQYDLTQLSGWSKALDCDSRLGQQRRYKGPDAIECKNPSLSFILAGQPGIFNQLFPAEAYDQGFMGRSIILFCDKADKREAPDNADDLWECLVEDMQSIAEMEGQFELEEGVWEKMREVHEDFLVISENPPHPRFAPYFRRKAVHGIKVAMALSAAESDAMILTLDHFNHALELLDQSEVGAQRAFRAAKNDEESLLINQILLDLRNEGKIRVKKQDLYRRLFDFTHPANMPILIETMINAGFLKKTDDKDSLILAPDHRKTEGKENVEEIKGKEDGGALVDFSQRKLE